MNENYSLIKNDYYICDNYHKDEFSIAIYFIYNNKCKIIIRRLDSVGWGQDVKIKIMSDDYNSFEKISIGSCEENLKTIEIYTKIILYKNDEIDKIKIPKVIIQTSNDDMNKNIYHYNSIMSFIDLNPEYEYKYFFDIDCREFIKDNCFGLENALNAFDLLVPGPLKADLFRYFYLYINGGCYFDCKMILRNSLYKIIGSNDSIILCSDGNYFYNGIIIIEKNNDIMKSCLEECINNILNKNKMENPYMMCGRDLFYKHFKNISPKMVRKGDYIYYENKMILKCFYKDYYHKYFNTEKDIQYMWKNNKYFYYEGDILSNKNFKYKFYYSEIRKI